MSLSSSASAPRLLLFSSQASLRDMPLCCTIQHPTHHSRGSPCIWGSPWVIESFPAWLAILLLISLSSFLMISTSSSSCYPTHWPPICLTSSLLMLFSSIPLISLSCHTSNSITSNILCLKTPTPFNLVSSHLILSSFPTSTNFNPFFLGGAGHPTTFLCPSSVFFDLLLILHSKLYN